MNKIVSWVALVVSVFALTFALVGGNQSVPVNESLGASGTRFPNGISADSTSPSSGQVRGTTLTATGALSSASATVVNGSSSSTVAVGSSSIGTNVGGVCYWNGSEYTNVSYVGSTTTATVATSTSCGF